MKALVYKGPGKQAIEDRPIHCRTTDAIVKIVKTTICEPTFTSSRATCQHAHRAERQYRARVASFFQAVLLVSPAHRFQTNRGTGRASLRRRPRNGEQCRRA